MDHLESRVLFGAKFKVTTGDMVIGQESVMGGVEEIECVARHGIPHGID